ncbi:MAG: oligoendopeptidase F [Candidatus Nitrohelix vancouverensis]|uniref:Oligopeptidase F n=1 Tax=Candidatus Nitrohelix vancouverensis TaxID=2705534 RepID=A0A7T0G1Y5_9BACT|nr:MAG: oligoendopeptidase F [Candidatus Nitrohelix vancouverensis]
MNAPVNYKSRDDIPEDSTWDLSNLYSADDRWEKEVAELESRVEGYAAFKGTFAKGAASIQSCIEFDAECMRQLDRVYTYAHLRNDEDKTKVSRQEQFEKAVNIATRLSQARSFIDSELMSIPADEMAKNLESESLKPYKLYLEKILRYREHTLSEQEEYLLASSMDMARAAREGFDMLDNADLKLGSVTDAEGVETIITHGNFQSLLQSYDRDLRKNSFHTFYEAYQNHSFTYGALLAGSVKKDLFYARARRYSGAREQALFSENISADVYDNLIASVHANLEPLYKYFDIRKRLLKLDELRVYDTLVPLVDNVEWNMSYEDAVEKIDSALQPLGADYVAILKQGLLNQRWVDRYESPGKRSGAYSSGCYDSNPYILMNYREDNINSVYTLIHEAGHSMHSYYSRKNQPYLDADYTIFVAEVASTFNEALLTRKLLEETTDPQMKIYLLCREIDNFRGTLYRQTMFAEFEREIHAAAESGVPLTADYFKSVYKKLLSLYFGRNVTLDECLSLECFRIPHFYFSFYVYKYATGISAAYALADRVSQGGKSELEDYLNFLRSGGSKYPIDLLKDAGVDMTSPQPVDAALTKFSDLVNQLETLTSQST